MASIVAFLEVRIFEEPSINAKERSYTSLGVILVSSGDTSAGASTKSLKIGKKADGISRATFSLHRAFSKVPKHFVRGVNGQYLDNE